MKRLQPSLIGGALLIFLGILLLLQNFEVIGDTGELWGALWAVIFAVGGLAFLWAFLRDNEQWWALIPGFALVGLGALIGLSLVLPGSADAFGGALFLGSIGLGFLAVYLVRREQWWAVIPAGVLLSLALMIVLEQYLPEGTEVASVLFLGMAVTFAVVGLLPTPQGRMAWAFIPAVVLGILGLALFTPFISAINFIWPAALILLGLYFLYRAVVKKQ